jgi:hypothetical protein
MNAFNDFRVEAWTEDGMWTRLVLPVVQTVKKTFSEVATGIAVSVSVVAITLFAVPSAASQFVSRNADEHSAVSAVMRDIEVRQVRIEQMIAKLGSADSSDISPTLLALATAAINQKRN